MATRHTPTVGPDSGTNFAGSVDSEVNALWSTNLVTLGTIAGSDSVITAKCVQATLDAYKVGQGYQFTPLLTNSLTNPTLNIDSRGARIIVDQDGGAIPPGKLVANRLHILIYDGTFLRIYGTGALVRFPMYFEGKPVSNEKLAAIIMTDSIQFPAGMVLSLAKAGVAATGTIVLSIQKNGVQFATVTFTASATGVLASSPSSPAVATGFVAGDVLTVIGPAGVDATLADFAVTLAATH